MNNAKKTKTVIIAVVCSVVLVCSIVFGVFACLSISKSLKNGVVKETRTEKSKKSEAKTEFMSTYKYDLANNQLSNFDIAFLKAENGKENKIYSPLSIKYTLKMLEEGAKGNSKDQISYILGDYVVTKYESNKNMSLANALFIRDTFKDSVKDDYITNLKKNYDADVIFDPFSNADSINKWVNKKTLDMIPNLIDQLDESQDFVLVNALGIDMEWENRFFDSNNWEKGFVDGVGYEHEEYWAGCDTEELSRRDFGDEKLEVSGMEIFASMDNYDIVKELGEDNIRKTVEEAYRKFIKENGINAWGETLTGSEAIDREVKSYLDTYIKEIKGNYTGKGEAKSIDFELYVDDDVKVFAKDLKQYNGTTLQYIGIMPVNEELDQFVETVDSERLNNIIGNLKELKRENFKAGVITRIQGFIPKFNFEYELKLKDDLAKLGITDIFNSDEADISGITGSKGEYISDAIHKANIEFTQDGIKAAAATAMGGKGAGGPEFDYIYEVPVEEIDLTFDKPYMFIIRDKDTGDVWFTGTVYEPTLYENDLTTYEHFSYN